VASLVLGMVGMPLSLFSIVPALALVFGYVGRSRIDQSGGTETGREMAGAGIVFGWIGMVIAVIWVGVLLAW
jgi:ABC-type sulfate transport system permease subunit